MRLSAFSSRGLLTRTKVRNLVIAGAVALLGHLPLASPAAAVSSGNAVQTQRGFDTCVDPSTGDMQTWWYYSPYYWFAPYIGGSMMGCGQPNLSAAYLNALQGQGWSFLNTWVGPQAPCTGYRSRFSYDTNTARNQGIQEAINAYNQLQALGYANSAANVVVVYDIEYYDTGNASCNAAVQAFMGGWAYQLHVPTAQVAGMYGTGAALNLEPGAGLDFVWGADYSGNPSTGTINGLNGGYWVNSQRFKQYVNSVNETYHGVTLNIDLDCANGPTTPTGTQGVQYCL